MRDRVWFSGQVFWFVLRLGGKSWGKKGLLDFKKTRGKASDIRVRSEHNSDDMFAAFGKLVGSFSFGPDARDEVAAFKTVK